MKSRHGFASLVGGLLAVSAGAAAAQVSRAPGCEDKPVPAAQPVAGKPAPPVSRLKLRVNLPAYRLELFQDDKLIRRYVVAIGDTAYPTPIGTFAVTRVDWDPWWVPPSSEWAQNDSITPPGPRNPMGRVRLAFRDLYFIHGTPYPHSVGSPASHGCVRLSNANAIELAKKVLALNAPGTPQAEVNQLAAKRGKTRTIPLEIPLPLEIRYDITAIRGRQLTIYPDVYRQFPSGRLLERVLVAAREALGDSIPLDTSRVLRAVARAGRRAVTVDVATLQSAVTPVGP